MFIINQAFYSCKLITQVTDLSIKGSYNFYREGGSSVCGGRPEFRESHPYSGVELQP